MTKKEQRQNEIIQLIKIHGNISAKDIAEKLHVSQMTIYRDLTELNSRTNNPASVSEQEEIVSVEPPAYNLLQAVHQSNEQKEKIGKFAATLIEENDIIIVDTGSTAARMLPYIPEHKNISVICFTANALAKLRHKQGIKIYFAGGVYHPNTELCESPEGIMFLKRHRANKVFLSAAGIHETLGLTCANEYEIATKKAILESASEHILLVDSDKFDRIHSSHFCDLDAIHSVISDQKLSSEWKQRFEDRGITLHLV